MSETGYAGRVTATAAAREAIAALCAAAGGPVMFVQSAGCCDGSDPMCLPDGELLIGDGDLLVGLLDGCEYYIDADLYDVLGRPRLLLDVEPGTPGGFSRAAGDGLRFTVRVLAPTPHDPKETP